MTEKTFKASNGLVISEIDEGDYMVTSPSRVEINVDPYQSKALREFFLHERDKELGRTRWPDDPDYVIYRAEESDDIDGRCVCVFHEPSANMELVWERWAAKPSHTSDLAARWYFTEGPCKKPAREWEQAEPGEVWRITFNGEEQNAIAEKASGELWFNAPNNYISSANRDITAGRKLLNTDGSVAE